MKHLLFFLLLFSFSVPGITATPGADRALAIVDAYAKKKPSPGKRILHLCYFTPSDRDPAPDYEARLTRVMQHIRKFYAREMKRHGFGLRTVNLRTNPEGALRFHLVRGAKPYKAYGYKSGAEIREECKAVLAKDGIDAERETIVIFCNLTEYDGKSITQKAPYYAGGTYRSGTAWLTDSAIMDTRLLAEKKRLVKDGQYGEISIGRYNSIFIGGTAHELGHAIGLPHNKERPDEAARGTALMGMGNQTYGRERRGEGKGSFLTFAHALRLLTHPMFSGSVKGMGSRKSLLIRDFSAKSDEKTFTLTGRVEADPPAYAAIAYLNPEGGSDYDATTATSVFDADNRFSLHCTALASGRFAELRLVICHSNGAISTRRFDYFVDDDGRPHVESMQMNALLADALTASNKGDIKALESEIEKLKKNHPKNTRLAAFLDGLWSARTPNHERPSPRAVAQDDKRTEIPLAATRATEEKVGWGRPMRNLLPEEGQLLSCGGRLFPTGIYAHSPASHRFDLGSTWKTLHGDAGLADHHGGSVVFIIRGDGKELWRSKQITSSRPVSFSLSVEGVKQLELIVDPVNKDNRSDWGLWLDPKLTR